MGIFDRPKNYKIRSQATFISYEERFQRLVKILNIVIDEFHNPLLYESEKNISKSINAKLNNLKDDFEYCRSTFSANHMDLNELAKKLKTYIFYLLKLHKNESLKITEQSDNHHVVEIDLMDIPSFSYDAKNWMIKVNDEDLWYLGR